MKDNHNGMIRVVDLRTDTVTKQPEAMKTFMMEANIGNDAFNEDSATIALQEKVAKLLDKEAALFVMSGTMGNLLCVMIHCDIRGSEVVLGNLSHIHLWEQGNISQLGGIHSHCLATFPDGSFDIDELKDAIRPNSIHFPVTKLVCIENPHCQLGGKVLDLNWLDKVTKACFELGIPVHMDGARLFNAAIALKVPPAILVKGCDTVSLSLSKGLGAPVGSVIAGSKDFIERARRLRKALGGGVRQPSMLAAAGIYCLDHMPKLLETDHEHAKAIAQAVHELKSPLVSVNPEDVHTNMVFLECDMKIVLPEKLCVRMNIVTEEEAVSLGQRIVIKSSSTAKTSVRLVLYFNITTELVELVIMKLRYIIKEYERVV